MDTDETELDNDETAPGRRIVAGTDGSASSIEAVLWAARQAELTDATLEVVLAWEWPTTYGWAIPVPDGFDPEADARRALESYVGLIRPSHHDLRITARVAHGHPAPVLVEASKGADLLVVGSRGHGEFVGMLIGSVSEYCATNAHCPVLVHRTPT
ncbi:MAG: universal stress protein [Acidimicrobiales bacterium]